MKEHQNLIGGKKLYIDYIPFERLTKIAKQFDLNYYFKRRIY